MLRYIRDVLQEIATTSADFARRGQLRLAAKEAEQAEEALPLHGRREARLREERMSDIATY